MARGAGSSGTRAPVGSSAARVVTPIPRPLRGLLALASLEVLLGLWGLLDWSSRRDELGQPDSPPGTYLAMVVIGGLLIVPSIRRWRINGRMRRSLARTDLAAPVRPLTVTPTWMRGRRHPRFGLALTDESSSQGWIRVAQVSTAFDPSDRFGVARPAAGDEPVVLRAPASGQVVIAAGPVVSRSPGDALALSDVAARVLGWSGRRPGRSGGPVLELPDEGLLDVPALGPGVGPDPAATTRSLAAAAVARYQRLVLAIMLASCVGFAVLVVLVSGLVAVGFILAIVAVIIGASPALVAVSSRPLRDHVVAATGIDPGQAQLVVRMILVTGIGLPGGT